MIDITYEMLYTLDTLDTSNCKKCKYYFHDELFRKKWCTCEIIEREWSGFCHICKTFEKRNNYD